MDVRSPLCQNIALILCGVLFLNPIVSTAAQLTVDAQAGGGTSLGQAGNGVPIVNIATPNGSGLSHNKFNHYNVGQQGLILNNASDKLQATQLGGIIVGNPNFKGQAAGLILNEVTGANASTLAGYTEVAGKSAAVIVANPHGISCDGCGFINTPRVTLTTGKPIVENGKLARFDVDGGQISIQGAGLNASNIEQFDLITRSAKINAELHANKLNVIAGRNQVDAGDLSVTAKAADGSAKPQLAIDSSALGGMYAGAIRLVGTEAGVGVKLAGDMAASGGDIRIDANGQLSLAQAAASQNLKIQAQGVNLTDNAYAAGNVDISASSELANRKNLAAAGSIVLQGGQLINQGVIEAGVNPDNSRNALGNVRLSGERLQNSGTVVANRDLEVQARQLLNNQAGTLNGKDHTQIDAGQVNNRAGRILAGSTLNMGAGAIDNRAAGLIHSHGAADVQVAGALHNQQGQLVSEAALGVQAQQLNNQAGSLSAGANLQLNAQSIDNSAKGSLSAAKQLNLTAASLNNSGAGRLSSGADMQVTLSGELNNRQQGLIGSQGALRIDAGSVDNQSEGELSSAGPLQLKAGSLNNQGGLVLSDASLKLETSGSLNNSSGKLSSDGTLTLTSGALNNAKGLLASGASAGVSRVTSSSLNNDAGTLSSQADLHLVSGAASSRDGGVIVTAGQLQLQADSLDASNSGRVVANGAADVQLDGQLDLSTGGQLFSGAALLLRAETIDNSKQGLISAKGAASIEAASIDNRQNGEISSKLGLTLIADELDNRDKGRVIAEAGLKLVADRIFNSAMGVLSAAHALNLQSRVLDNRSGRILSGALLSLNTQHIDNAAQGRISAGGDLLLVTQQLDNQQKGEVLSAGTLELRADHIDSHGQGLIAGEGAMAIRVTEALDLSQGGQIIGEAALDLQAASLSTRKEGLVAANGALQVTATSIDNAEGGEISSQNSLTLNAGSLDNSDGGRITGEAGINASLEQLDNRRNGLLASNAGLVLQAKQIDNSAGGTLSGVQLLALNAETLNNQGAGRVLSGGDLQLTLDKLNNSNAGLLSSHGDLLLQGTELDNRGGKILADGQGKVVADSLDSSDGGQLSSLGDLEVEVKTLKQQGGELLSNAQLDLRVDTLDNSNGGLVSGLQGLSISADSLTNQGGELSTDGNLSIQATRLDNSAAGKVIAGNVLSLTVAQLLNQAKGVLSGRHSLTLSGASLDNSGAGLLVSQGAIDLTLAAALHNRDGGSLLAQGPLKLQAASLDNSQDGLLSSKAGMDLELTGDLNNQAGTLIADGALQLSAQQLDNSLRGVLNSKGDLSLSLSQVDNSGAGSIASDGKLDLKAERLHNSQGQVASKGDLRVELDELVQQGGELLSQGKLTLNAGAIDNSQAGLIAATQGIDIVTGNLDNSAGGEISSSAAVHIDAADLDNSDAGLVIGDGGLWLTVQRLFNQSLGLLSGRDGLVVQADSLDNSQGGTLTSQQQLDVQVNGALDNHAQGALLSEGSLKLHAGELNNASGVLSSAGELAIVTGTLNNQGGKLVTDDQLNVTSSSLNNSQSGRISAKRALSISTGQLDNQQQGLISGAAAVTLTTAQLNNHNQGLIAAKGAAHISATGLDQHLGGELLSESALTLDLQGGALNNSQAGLIATPGALLLHNLGAVDNSADGEISSSQGFLLKASQLNNSAGRVISGQELQLQITQALLNNLKGVLSAAKLRVAAASLDNSGAGVLASKGDIQLSLTGKLDNHDQGTISAAQALSIASASLDNSNDGLLASSGALQLHTGATNNQGGSILSQATLDASTAALDNRGGVLSSQQALTLSAGAIDNRDNGLITSAGKLTLNAANLDSSRHLAGSGGEVSAKQALQLTVSQLIQQQGRLIGEAGVRIDFKGGDLDNRGGLLSATGPLTLLNLGKLDNRNAGEVSSSQSYSLAAGAIDNGDQGRLLSAGNLSLDLGSGTLRNAEGGLISGWQGLTVKAGNLDNRALGTLSSRDGALKVDLNGVLNNSGAGALVSKSKLTVAAASLDNSNKGIVSSKDDAQLSLGGALNNSASGLIDSQGALVVSAGAINNHAGQIGSLKAANLTATSLDNSAGQLSSNAALSLSLSGNLTNTQNAKLASAGPLLLKAAAIDNQGGSLISQNLLSLTGSSLNNVGGTLAARNGLSLLLTGALNNSADGLIHSQLGTLAIRAHSLNNQGGTLSSQQDLSLNLDAKLDNQGGHIQSQVGNLDLQKSSAVDNSAGVLSSLQGWLRLVTAGLFDNDAGTTQAQSLEIDAKGLDNRGGHISALSGDTAIDSGSATFNNQGGGLYAHQLLKLITGDFNNQGAGPGQGGKVAAGQIDFGLSGVLTNSYGILESDSTLSLAAASIDNRYGSLRALGSSGDTRLDAASLDNRNGTIETANSNLGLNVASLQSSGGSILHVGTGNFGLSAAQVTGAGGDLSTNGLLTLTADNWSNSGVLQAGQLVLNIGNFTQTASGQLLAGQSFNGSGSNWVNHGLLASDGNFSLNLSGAYSGDGQASSLGDLNISADSISLAGSSRIAGGGLTNVSASGLLSNLGKLTSAVDLTVTANTLNNYGTLGSAENLRIVAPTLLNESGLIFSGGDMTLRVNSFTNKFADVYSLGMLSIDRDGQGGLASSIINSSSSIQSDGSMSLAASTIHNIRALLTISDQGIYTARIDEIACIEGVNAGDCSGKRNYVWQILQRDKLEVTDASSASSITAGGNLSLVGAELLNQSSTIATGGNLTAVLNSLSNSGVETGDIQTTRVFRSERTRNASSWFSAASTFNNKYWHQSSGYDANDLSGLEAAMSNFIARTERELHEFGQTITLASGDQSYAAIIQAAGTVNINASEQINSGVIRPSYAYVAGGSRSGDTATGGSRFSTPISLNAQLPPDLAQQQVNPLTLPGFSLPQGENGLFRLSGQQGQSATVNHAQSAIVDRTLSGRSIALGQQEQSLAAVEAQGRSFAVVTQGGQSAAQVTASERLLNSSTASLQTSASAVTVDAASNLAASAFNGQSLPATATLPGAGEQIHLSEQTLDPGALVVQPLAQGQSANVSPPSSHKYLIETNPELTNLKQFLGSDYMLGNLGYTPDNTRKRLGDGLYEQRLIRESVVARTGQRFLAGLNSDEAMFRYLMDNAIASKRALNLSLGVTLSAEQVIALTHDIVWLEEYVVNGEKVLVPVLYLAQAEGRLRPNGALIQGQDVALISGGDLLNQGTLRASNNLRAVAGGSISNRGLIEASNRLELLATNSIRNAQGGIIAGRDVSLTALTGDVINERSITVHQSASGNRTWERSFADSAARIEASNRLDISAGRDIANLGSVMHSRGDLNLDAGRDVTIASVEQRTSESRGSRYHREQIAQLGAEVAAGRDLTTTTSPSSAGNLSINAGRDLNVVASQLEARRDISLAAGQDVTLAAAANESHFYSKSKKVTRQEDHVRQQATEVNAGGDVFISSGQDLTLLASKVEAGKEAYLVAGNNIALLSAEDQDYSYYFKKKKSGDLFSSKTKTTMSEASSSRAVSSSIRSGSDLILVANNDITARGAQLSSDETISLYAGQDIVLNAAENAASQASGKSKSSLFSSKASSKSSATTSLTSTSLSGKNVELSADNDITLRAAAIHAEEGIILDAGRDIAISSAQQSQQSSQASKSNKLNWHLTDSLATNGSFTLENKGKGGKQSSVQEVGSTLSGGTIDINSGRDTSIRGSTLVADRNIRVDAARNLSVVSGETSNTSSATSKTKNTGEIGNWYQGATGVASLKESNQNSSVTQTASQIASLGGNVELTAGERYHQVASHVIAPEGDISIIGKQVDIEAGYDKLSESQKQSSNRTALGGSVSVPLVDAVRNIQQMSNAAENTGDTRLKSLAAVNVAMNAQRGYEAAQAMGTVNLTGIKVSVNLSNNKGNSSSSQSGQNVVSSTIAAGRDVNISAVGDGKNSNLNVVGSQVDAVHNVNLKAGGDINLLSAQNTAQQRGDNANSGWSVGVGFGLGGTQNGFTLDLAANKGKGNSDGESVTQSNTAVRAGNAVNLTSGDDTNLKGAVVSANQVKADVGGDFNVVSLQDIDNYKSKQKDASVGISLCIPPFCYGVSSSGTASFGQQKIDSTYASVVEQTGIKAGDGGFQIDVAGNTDLQGAVIASTDKAVADGKNSLTTGTLTHSDVKNEAEYKGTSISLSGGYSGNAYDKQGNVIKGTDGKPLHEPGVTAGTPIALSASGEDSSYTRSGISGGVITITDGDKQQQLTHQTAQEAVASINRDVASDKDGSNTLKPIFDREEVEAGFEITRQFVQNVGAFLDDRAKQSTNDKKALDEELAKPADQQDREKIAVLAQQVLDNKTWEVGGTGRALLSALGGAAGGNVTGGSAQLLQGAAVNYLQGLATEQVKHIADYLDSETARTALQALVGCAGAAAQSQSCGSGALGASASVVLNNLIERMRELDASTLSDAEKQARINLVSSLVAGISAAAGGDAVVAANAANIETSNNYLESGDLISFGLDMASCRGNEECQRNKWAEQGYSAESIYNDDFAKDVSGSLLAKYKMQQIAAGLAELTAMECDTPTCEAYQAELLESALTSYQHLSEVVGEWAPSMDRLSLILGGAPVPSSSGLKPRPPGSPELTGGLRIQKAIDYLAEVKGPKVPPKLQPFTNPPQGPVIPSNWVSRPGRTPGSTIYYPPGTDPSAPGSTYIRLMPSGSTPVPGLENGYWISVKNGQPINPTTGGTGTRGETHVPLPPNTMPPTR